jgi:capsular polysaccharide biosynthesis protein
MEQDVIANEIDLMSLLGMLLRKWYIILGFTLLFFIGSLIYAYVALEDQYTANASMMVLVSNEEQSNEQNFNFSSKLVKTYTELAKSNIVVDQVIERLGLSCGQENLRNRITVTGVQDTIIIKLSIVSNDQQMSMDIANTMVTVMQEVSGTYDGFDNIEILDQAQLPLTPSGPNRMLYLAIGIIIGGITGVGIIFITEMLDKTIKTHKDIEQKLKLRVLATIPEYDVPEDQNHEK